MNKNNFYFLKFCNRLESLRTLILSDNSLSRIQLTTDDVELTDTDENDLNIVGTSKVRLMFPNLSMLDISNNCLKVSEAKTESL